MRMDTQLLVVLLYAKGESFPMDGVKVLPPRSLFQMTFGAKKLSLTFLWT